MHWLKVHWVCDAGILTNSVTVTTNLLCVKRYAGNLIPLRCREDSENSESVITQSSPIFSAEKKKLSRKIILKSSNSVHINMIPSTEWPMQRHGNWV